MTEETVNATGAPARPADAISHPSHYQGRVEVIEAIESWGLGYRLGNAVKYIAREARKDGGKDLRKALWYLVRELLAREGQGALPGLLEIAGSAVEAPGSPTAQAEELRQQLATSRAKFQKLLVMHDEAENGRIEASRDYARLRKEHDALVQRLKKAKARRRSR